jgi:hypothetical protein
MREPFKFYHDPGHGWLAVKRVLLEDLGIETQITRFSYQRGKTVYLEEDCDVGTFFVAFMAKHGRKPEVVSVYHHDRSRIRSYDFYRSATITTGGQA